MCLANVLPGEQGMKEIIDVQVRLVENNAGRGEENRFHLMLVALNDKRQTSSSSRPNGC